MAIDQHHNQEKRPAHWGYRCPHGHAKVLKFRSGNTYRCGSCETLYRGEPYEADEHDFPVDGADEMGVDINWVSVVHALDDYRRDEVRSDFQPTTVIADDLNISEACVGQHLAIARQRGLVEQWRPESNGTSRWQLTDDGIDAVEAQQQGWTNFADGTADVDRGQLDPMQVLLVLFAICMTWLLVTSAWVIL